MAIMQSDMVFYKCLDNPTDSVSTLGGGISTNTVTGAVGDIFPILVTNPGGGSTIYRFGKVFLKNNSVESLDLHDSAIRISNALLVPISADVMYLVSDSVYDDNSKVARIIGVNSSGQADWEEILLAGTSPVIGNKSWLKVSRVEIRQYTSSRTLTNATGNITVSMGVLGSANLGTIPAACNYGNGEIDIYPSTVLDDVDTVANALTAPSGATWIRPITPVSLPVTTITYNHAIGIWVRITLYAGIRNTEAARFRFEISGD